MSDVTTSPPSRGNLPRPRRADAIAAEAKFRAEVARQGGKVIGDYVNSRTKVLCTCKDGHECYPTPTSTTRGVGICRRCAGQDPKAAEAKFRAAVEAQGGTVVGEYVKATVPVLVTCAEGHECRPWPSYINSGGGICAICSGRARGLSEPQFRQRVAELAGTITGEYVNTHTPVLVRCEEGHENRVIPKHVVKGTGICRTCAGQDSKVADAAFRATVERHGGVVLGSYVNAMTAVLVRCVERHETKVQPNNLVAGQGVCRICRGSTWDVLYTVTDEGFEILKFGVTSGNPHARLRNHRLDGLDTVVRLHEQLPDGIAKELEDTIKAALRDAGETPVRGSEYFHLRALPVVLDIVDNHPAIKALTS
ncbi:hypothetical protein AB0N14_18050 [Streptomyces sp. NPDC051104]|uniref:hypothetical protein n=1 Tax=Streptomyces sp. NPDC051104 TaxID=3155044 RepID=UPI00342CBD82